MSLQALLDGHRGIYGADGERRLAEWLRQDIQQALDRPASGPVNAVRNTVPPVSPAPVGKRVDKRLTPDEVAERLRLTKKTLANWRFKGKGPRSFKMGGPVYYLESEVDAWEQAQINGGKP